MSDAALGAGGFVLALFLVACGVPVAIATGAVGAVGFWWLNGWTGLNFVLGSVPFEAIFPYSFSVIPLFIMMGVVMAHAGLSRALFDALNAAVGRLNGGLALASIGACAFFGAICGSSLATAATMGRVAIPEMERRGYNAGFAAATVAAGGTLGVLIPPSIILVIYGLLTQTSIGALFIAALVPGVLATLLYAGAVMIAVRSNPRFAPRMKPGEAADTQGGFGLDMVLVALLFVVVIGGIFTGLFSPTESAAVGAVGALLLAGFRKALSRRTLMTIISETASMSGMIFLLIIGAALFNYFLETTGIPQALISIIEASGLSAAAVIVLILIFYLILGCFLDSMSMILLTVPFLGPLAVQFGFDMVWFGIIIVVVAEIGLITPPVGMNLFVVQAVAPSASQKAVLRGIAPFIAADIIRLALLATFPILTLWLPGFLK